MEKAYEEKIKDMCHENESDKQSVKDLTNQIEAHVLRFQQGEMGYKRRK